jgi:hypothetical protein
VAQTITARSDGGGWVVRRDAAHGNVPNAQRHVHITRRGLGGEYSWNVNGTRHDEHKFPSSEKCIKRAKEIAAKHLGVPEHTLQLILALEGGARVVVEEIGRERGEPFTYRSHVGPAYYVAVFGHEDELVIVTNSRSDAGDI